jgi:hypothetical protein
VLEVPPTVVTVTSTLPAISAGLAAVIWPALLTVKLVAGTVPKSTAVAPVKSIPVIVTVVSPCVGPAVGVIPVTLGAATKVKMSASEVLEVPPTVVTVTSKGLELVE